MVLPRQLGPYEILAAIGAGGMGEVYRARDAKLGRDVAIKILPASLADDPERLARFEREAKALASLNHTNIAQIYGFEGHAIVMELVDGGTLADRIAGGPLNVADALAIARQIADALDAAHQKGIVHRDLKPSNIGFTGDDIVKVLDFGLAKDASGETQASSLTHSPTMLSPTMTGMLLGTAPYMSPEQARGKPVDKRTDIWAFGCVLFEMLTGTRAFLGETTTDTIVAILEREPDWAVLSSSVPDTVVTTLKRCLEKDPKLRLRDIGDIRLDPVSGRSPQLRTRLQLLPWALAAVFALSAVALGVALARRENPAAAAKPAWATEGATFSIQAPVDHSDAVIPQPTIAISRDGRYIAWVGNVGPAQQPSLWLYEVSNGTTRQIAGTNGAGTLFWAPDSRAIGFQSQGMLRTIDVTTGAIRSLAPNPQVSAGGAWSPSGVIVFSTRYSLQMIPATGGEPRVVATLNAEYQENSLRFPRFLPDGRHFLYVARSGRTSRSAAYVGSIDGEKPKRLFPVSSHVEYVPPGYLVYIQDEQLVARRFDPDRMTAEPELTTVLSRFGGTDGGMRGHFTLSDNGVLAYLAEPATPSVRFRWVDRTGRDEDAGFPAGDYTTFRVAPDGRRVVVDNRTEHSIARDVWVLDPSAPPRRVTFGGSDDWQPFWSADGLKLAWMSYRNGTGDLFAKELDGAAPEAAVFKPSEFQDDQRVPGDWAPDGRSIAYWTDRSDTRGDVWVQSLDGSKPIAIAATSFNEMRPRFAPDGRFVAYESDELGQNEIFIQPVPPTGGKWQISISGGSGPSWRHDGRELYYVNSSGDLVAVPITTSDRTLSVGSPVRLFSGLGFVTAVRQYDPAPDGSRFLVRRVSDPPAQPIMVVLDWTARLVRK
ncbi:MAG TPA: protein kinase [Vicinamibacterales bacterium]|nr:protein kinase [Vicinamibacterales bacterium]